MKHVNMFHEKDMLLNKFSYELSKKQKKTIITIIKNNSIKWRDIIHR